MHTANLVHKRDFHGKDFYFISTDKINPLPENQCNQESLKQALVQHNVNVEKLGFQRYYLQDDQFGWFASN
ncbi:hypothetical protein FXN58_10970 [Aggregatibacter actinomycetemcomitans]|uniref:hypothetical protein n=1 Tax=Aggregatibacter actinomycetemcomitans TaxID=714 RepID=UPI0011DCF089|nr:hypothetical protein [Aggregatibacter actinomycetemcomitans]QEH45986.1 hypothetical protein FXN58_10970 [Aggregatibacter actinomycetemcomitans]